MIEDIDVKIAESPEEAFLTRTIENAVQRIREMKLTLEIEEVVLEFLKKKKFKYM